MPPVTVVVPPVTLLSLAIVVPTVTVVMPHVDLHSHAIVVPPVTNVVPPVALLPLPLPCCPLLCNPMSLLCRL